VFAQRKPPNRRQAMAARSVGRGGGKHALHRRGRRHPSIRLWRLRRPLQPNTFRRIYGVLRPILALAAERHYITVSEPRRPATGSACRRPVRVSLGPILVRTESRRHCAPLPYPPPNRPSWPNSPAIERLLASPKRPDRHRPGWSNAGPLVRDLGPLYGRLHGKNSVGAKQLKTNAVLTATSRTAP
jgi:hypothetical protein